MFMSMVPPEREMTSRRTKMSEQAGEQMRTPMPMPSKILIALRLVRAGRALRRAATAAGSGPAAGSALSASTVTPSFVTERKPPAMS